MSIPGSLSQAVSTAKAPYVFRLKQSVAEAVTAPLYKQGGAAPSLDTGYTATLAWATHRESSDRTTLDSTSLTVADEEAVFTFTTTHTADPKLCIGRIDIKNASGTTVDRLPCYLEVEPDLLDTNDSFPVTIDNVRARLQDRAAADNRVLDAFEFEDGEIAEAIMGAVDLWNEIAYPGLPMYTATTFLYREQLILAAVGRVYLNKAANLQRNRLPALGEGMKVDDVEHRVALYQQEGTRLWEEWKAYIVARIKQVRYAEWVGDSRSEYY